VIIVAVKIVTVEIAVVEIAVVEVVAAVAERVAVIWPSAQLVMEMAIVEISGVTFEAEGVTGVGATHAVVGTFEVVAEEISVAVVTFAVGGDVVVLKTLARQSSGSTIKICLLYSSPNRSPIDKAKPSPHPAPLSAKPKTLSPKPSL
jgi:hypothetical protein